MVKSPRTKLRQLSQGDLGGILLLLVVWVPIIMALLRAFSRNVYSTELWTWKAFAGLSFSDPGIGALRNSLFVAVAVAVLSCFSAFLVVILLILGPKISNHSLLAALLAPILIPDLIGGVAWNAFFAFLGARLSLTTVIIAQYSYCHIYALLIFLFGASRIDPEQPDIGLSLAGSRRKVLTQLLLPRLAPYALVSILLVFVLSLDDFVVAFFTSGPGTGTLPVYLYALFRRGFSAKLFALAAILTSLSLLLALSSEIVMKGVTNMAVALRRSKLHVLLFLALSLSSAFWQGCRRAEAPRVLHVYNWNDYMIPEVLREFEREYDVKVVHDIYSSNDELYAKVKDRNSGYDVVVPSDYMVAIMIREGRLAAIGASSLANFSNILPGFRNLAFDPGNRYSVPYFFGSTGIAFDGTNAAMLKAVTENGFGVFFGPEFADLKYTIVDDMRYGLGLPLKYLGFDVNTQKESEIKEAAELLRKIRPRILAFSGDSYIELLARSEISLAYGYSGDVANAAKENRKLLYRVPASGTILGVDNLAVLAESKRQELALQFINFVLRPRVHARIANGINWGCPNGPARKYIRQELLSNTGIYLPDNVVARSTAIRDVGPAAEKLYSAAWRSVTEK